MVGQASSQWTLILVLAMFMMLGPAVPGVWCKPSPIVNPARQSPVTNPAY